MASTPIMSDWEDTFEKQEGMVVWQPMWQPPHHPEPPHTPPHASRKRRRPFYRGKKVNIVKAILLGAGSGGLTAEQITDAFVEHSGACLNEWTGELKRMRPYLMSSKMEGTHWVKRRVDKETRYFSMQAPPDRELLNEILAVKKKIGELQRKLKRKSPDLEEKTTLEDSKKRVCLDRRLFAQQVVVDFTNTDASSDLASPSEIHRIYEYWSDN